MRKRQGEGELPNCYRSMYTTWLRLLTMLLPGRTYIVLGPWHFEDFHNIFLPNIGEDQKTSYDLSAGPQGGTAL